MDIRNVQKSGNTHYIYLPAAWCRNNNISAASKVSLETSSEGNLLIMPTSAKEKDSHLFLNIKEDDMRIINKFVVASYLNPVKSFKIKIDREITSLDILIQKRLLAGIEVVEFGENQIMCESSVTVEDPDILLKTMIKKIVNMLHVMMKGGSHELLERYEEEVDRSNMLINKAVVSALMFRRSSNLRNIDLFYIAMLSKNLEGFTDNLPKLKKHKALQKACWAIMILLLKRLEDLTIDGVVQIAKESGKFGATIHKTEHPERLMQLKSYLEHVVDTLVDWAVTAEVDRTK